MIRGWQCYSQLLTLRNTATAQLQIYADVMNMDLKIAASAQAPALGAAIFGAVAGDRGWWLRIPVRSGQQMGRVRELAFH
jgi:L-ribulokinase